MNFAPTDVAAACRQYGNQVQPLVGIDGATLLWALSGNESTFGVNCTPRHEPAFDVGGTFYKSSPQQQYLVLHFGSKAAMSYGPWQMMFCNFPQGTTPDALDSLETCAKECVAFLNKQLAHFKPVKLVTIGQIWNSGEPRLLPSPGVQAYCKELAIHYSAGITE